MPTPANSPLLSALAQKRDRAKDEFTTKHEFAQKWLEERGLTLSQIREHSARLLTGVTLSGALLLASPQIGPVANHSVYSTKTLPQLLSKTHVVKTDPLSQEKEAEILNAIKELYGVSAVFELDRNRLPTYVGKMGLEQHLVRFPGDSLSQQGAFLETGIAPARGAFGYFAEAGKTRTQMEEEERFYLVLQTFLILNWNRDWVTLKEWYRFRKFLVINTETGKAVVAVLGDSGPAVWTGKHFGGSPETMAGLGFYPKKTKGEVLVLYLDDPGNIVPLGPLALK